MSNSRSQFRHVNEIRILQKSSPTEGTNGPLGLLFEVASDSAVRRLYPSALPLPELIGDIPSIKVKAAALARKLLIDEPKIRGLCQLSIFEEVVIRELQFAFQVLHLHNVLLERGVGRCRFAEPSRIANALAQVARSHDSGLEVIVPLTTADAATGGLARSWGRLKATEFSYEQWRKELQQIKDRVDPYHRRELIGHWRHPVVPRDTYWFYSTAYTFTRIGLLYEPFFNNPYQYLIENPLTGGKPLAECGRAYFSPYRFAVKGMAPPAAEVRQAVATITEHLAGIPLNATEVAAREIFLISPFFSTFLARHLPLGLFQTSLFRRWVEVVQPAALITGNPVFEGYALQAARLAGIPTLLLQHGILGDFCQFIDPPVDHYLVRGRFWRDFLPPPAAQRALILDPPQPAKTCEDRQSPKDQVLFLTAPYDLSQFYHECDLDDILRVLLDAIVLANARIMIRVHPLEQVAYYERKIEALKPAQLADDAILYSQGPGLDELLEKAAVAVTYCSTVFLDCLRYHVPVISFAWHDFSYKRLIEAYGVFHFAHNLAELRQLLDRGLSGALPAYDHSIEPFLASTPEDQLRERLDRIMREPARLAPDVTTMPDTNRSAVN